MKNFVVIIQDVEVKFGRDNKMRYLKIKLYTENPKTLAGDFVNLDKDGRKKLLEELAIINTGVMIADKSNKAKITETMNWSFVDMMVDFGAFYIKKAAQWTKVRISQSTGKKMRK